nr:ferrochelatase [Myxococcota bacterium]
MKSHFVVALSLVLMTFTAEARSAPIDAADPNDRRAASTLSTAGKHDLRGVIEKIRWKSIRISGKWLYTGRTIWLDEDGQATTRDRFEVGDLVAVQIKKWGRLRSARVVQRVGGARERVALLFVGHGEPETAADGDVPITLADGTPFGPHAEDLGVPGTYLHTEWAAAYEEIATAMTYIFPDLNGNGVLHELDFPPSGDVPPFFTWNAFHASVYQQYEACNDYSPHNDSLREHVASLTIEVDGAEVAIFLAFLDAVPRIRDVLSGIAGSGYDELVVVPMLLASSTHTQEVAELVEEAAHLTEDMEVVVTEPFFEVPFVRRRLRDAVASMVKELRASIPAEAADHEIGVLLASHGTPYVPPFPEFGWQEGEIYSELIPTEDAFHDEIGARLPWMSLTGRMNYSSPTVEDALGIFDAEGFRHVIVVPSAFPTAAIHTMWDVANAAVGRAVLPQEGVVVHERPSGVKVYYAAQGFADLEDGRDAFRQGLGFLGRMGVIEALQEDGAAGDDGVTPYRPCEPGLLCVTVAADQVTGSALQFALYETTEADWPQAVEDLPIPGWVVVAPPPLPDRFPARLRIPLEGNLLPVAGETLEGARLGLAITSSDGAGVEPTDARGFSSTTVLYEAGGGMNFERVELVVPQAGAACLPGEICVTVTAQETTGPDLKLLLYEATDAAWPQEYQTLPTPSWVVTETPPVPAEFPIHIRIPLAENLFAISSEPLEGARLGLAVVTGVASTFIVEPTDARGFSQATLVYQPGAIMDYGEVELAVPQGDPCELNPFGPDCLSGPLFWEERVLGSEGFVPGAIYMDVADVDGDGI